MTRFALKTSIGIGLLALGALALNAEASARKEQHPGLRESRSVTVAYGELALAEPGAVETLYARLERASRAVCGTADARLLRLREDVRTCRAAALDAAVADVDDDALSALHAGSAQARRLFAAAMRSTPSQSGS